MKCGMDWWEIKSEVKLTLGVDNFGKLNLKVLQRKEEKIGVVSTETKNLQFDHKREQEFGQLFTIQWTIRNFEYGVKFKDSFVPFQQNGLKKPIHLQPAVQNELTKFINSIHLTKLLEVGEGVCVIPAVIAKKSDGSVKIALNAKESSKRIADTA